MKYEIINGKLYIEEAEVNLPERVDEILNYEQCLLVLVKPEFVDLENWKKEWTRLKHYGNVFKVDQSGKVVGHLDESKINPNRLF